MVILDIDMEYGLMIWEMTVSIWSSWRSIWDILSPCLQVALLVVQEILLVDGVQRVADGCLRVPVEVVLHVPIHLKPGPDMTFVHFSARLNASIFEASNWDNRQWFQGQNTAVPMSKRSGVTPRLHHRKVFQRQVLLHVTPAAHDCFVESVV